MTGGEGSGTAVWEADGVGVAPEQPVTVTRRQTHHHRRTTPFRCLR